MAFTKEIIDFAGLSDSAIKAKLTELNIPLTPDEALKIQNDMLGRAPSLAELILFSIQGSGHVPCWGRTNQPDCGSSNHATAFTSGLRFNHERIGDTPAGQVRCADARRPYPLVTNCLTFS